MKPVIAQASTVAKAMAATLLAAGVVASGAAVAQDKPIVGSVQGAKTKVAMCIGCHGIPGYQASFPAVYRVPKIGNQNEAYIAAALKAYRSGERNHPTMVSIAVSLSDQDIADLAAYYAAKPLTAAKK